MSRTAPAGAELIAGFDTAMAAADETILAPLDEGSPEPDQPVSTSSARSTSASVL